MQEMLFVFNLLIELALLAFQKEKTGNQVEETTQETKQNFPELKKADFKIERIYQMSDTEWRETQTLPERQGFLCWVLSSDSAGTERRQLQLGNSNWTHTRLSWKVSQGSQPTKCRSKAKKEESTRVRRGWTPPRSVAEKIPQSED